VYPIERQVGIRSRAHAVKALARNVVGHARFILAARWFRALPSRRWESALPVLRSAWGNLGYTADISYLAAVLHHAMQAGGPILECGSGLTTFLLAIASGQAVWSLEHLAEWRRRTQTRLGWVGVGANVLHAPLRPYGSYDWYAVPASLPSDFRLVVCDGPPGETRGGRYGLLPLLGHHLSKGARLLLDDAERSQEQRVLQRWQKEADWEYVIEGERDQAYAVVTISRNAMATRSSGVEPAA
jgi:hypothetical protein